jgi:hypothetical protein
VSDGTLSRGPTRRGPGLHVAFLGIDGIGKSSLARMLVDELRGMGIPIELVAWREQMVTDPRPNVAAALQELWVESWRLIFLGSEEAASMPRTFAGFEEDGWEDRFADVNLASNPPAGPLASAWLELCGQALVHYEVIQPLRDQGTWAIEESYGFKLVVKELLSARALADDPRLRAEIDFALSIVPELYRRRAPDLGVFVSGPVEMAYRWRLAEAGATRSMEDMGAVGQKGWEGFEALQSESNRMFRELAQGESWLTLEMEDAPAEANFARLMEAMRARLGDELFAPA